MAEPAGEQQAVFTIREVLGPCKDEGLKHVASGIPHPTCRPNYQNKDESEEAADKFKIEFGLNLFGPFKGGCVQATAPANAMEQAILKLQGERLVGPPLKGLFEWQLAKLLARTATRP